MTDLLLDQLLRAAVAGGLFAGAVWFLVRTATGLPPSIRCGLWWAATLKFLVALLWVAPLEIPLLPAAVPAPAGPSSARIVLGTVPAPAADPAGEPAPPGAARLPWRETVAFLWLAGIALSSGRLARELRAARRLRLDSTPAADPRLLATFDRLRKSLGLGRPVELRLSERITGPLTLGLCRPAVVLPARGLRRLAPEELEMALCHELLHVRRRDLWTGWIPQIARRLFFFHPLAALAAREYLLAREAACDAAVLRELGAPPRSYGRLLLRWAVPPGRRPVPAVGVAAGASPSFLDLKRRLEMLQSPSFSSRRLKAVGAALASLALAALLPLRIVAQPPLPPEPPAPPAAPAAPAPAAAPVPAALPPPAPEASPAPPPLAPAPRTAVSTTWSWSEDESWALLEGDSHIWMSGSSGDLERARHLQNEADAPLLWFRRDSREYVVRDAETIERVRAILEPQRELGRQQGELGSRQGLLGSEQGALGARQGELGAEQGRLGAEQAELAARQAQLTARAVEAGRSAEARSEREDLSRRMRELGERQRELGDRQRELGARQRELGDRQRALGKRQRELGERQRAAAEVARTQLRELLDRALADGTAEPIR